jgi:hypothetical protein
LICCVSSSSPCPGLPPTACCSSSWPGLLALVLQTAVISWFIKILSLHQYFTLTSYWKQHKNQNPIHYVKIKLG